MSALILQAALVPAAVLLAAGCVGLLAGAVAAFWTLAIGWGVLIALHVRNLGRLAHWADAGPDAEVPEGQGAWGVAWSALYQRVRNRRAHERDLTHTIERFRSAAEAVPDGMVVLDATNRIKWANARAQVFLGLDVAHDIGAPLTNLVRQPAFVQYLEASDQTEPLVQESFRGAGTTLAIQIVPFGIEERLLIARDVTQLEAVARMRRDFIANVSHELKTPLTVIRGFIETLQDLPLEPRQHERYLQLMQEQARNMQRLVDDLLALSALESEKNPLQDTPFAMVPLLLSLSTEAKALSQGQHQVALDIGDAAMVTGSRDEIASACGNLVSNAIRYTPAGGRIALSWRIDAEGRGVFAVQDTGVGIAPEHLPRLTERFYRVDRSRSRATGGTGLGLAIVKHVLIRHQAELGVVSEPGKGSVFSIVLPAKRVQRVTVAEESVVPEERPGT